MRVLFVCVGNSGRIQMAEAFFNQISKTAKASSAGTKPATSVNPLVIQVMREVGIDIIKAKPKMLTLEMLDAADRIITMGCEAGDVCPSAIVETEDWKMEDPRDKPVEKIREIRNIIREKVMKLVSDMESNE
ncbi:MAG: arsenate reductase ArsC [Methanobacteriota archaeon]